MIQTQAPINNLYIGIMSGTSVDAIDIVAIRIEDNHFSFVGGVNFEFPNHLRTKILEITREKEEQDSKIIAQLDIELGSEYANAVNQLLRTYKIKKEKVTAIGLHGQTIAHDPNAAIPRSVQIGDAKLVAQKTGIICVADFRSADINAGGQGAPRVLRRAPRPRRSLRRARLWRHPRAEAPHRTQRHLVIGALQGCDAPRTPLKQTSHDDGSLVHGNVPRRLKSPPSDSVGPIHAPPRDVLRGVEVPSPLPNRPDVTEPYAGRRTRPPAVNLEVCGIRKSDHEAAASTRSA